VQASTKILGLLSLDLLRFLSFVRVHVEKLGCTLNFFFDRSKLVNTNILNRSNIRLENNPWVDNPNKLVS